MKRPEDDSRPCTDGLPPNIVRFTHLLRENAIGVSFSSVMDILRGIDFVDVSHIDEFYHLLRSNLVCRKEDLEGFDRLFYEFWFDKSQPTLQIPSMGNDQPEEEDEPEESVGREELGAESSENDATDSISKMPFMYSPHSRYQEKTKAKVDFLESQAFYEYLCKLLHPLSNRLSRRYQYTIHGKEVSLRRILRKNMQFGGELILLDFKKKKLKKRKIILFCDVSGSMDTHTLMILQFVHALKNVDHRTEIFSFSTELTRLTSLFDMNDVAAVFAQAPGTVRDLGGGTRIGHCLRCFNETYGSRLLSSKTIVMIFSDGYDRGEIDLLEQQMAYLKRRVYKTIWLNPLLGIENYEPICRGMSAALPYVDRFLPLSGLHDLQLLEKSLEEMVA